MTRWMTLPALAGLLIAGAQAAEPAPDDLARVQASLTKWKQAREACGGNYSYKVRWSSFVGFGHETKIMVQDNKVVVRQFHAFSGRPVPVRPGQDPAKPQGEHWIEKSPNIGSHKKGAPPRTLDQLYTEALQVAKRPLQQHERRYVRFDKQGLLLACFTVDTRIADDAPTKGVTISSLSLGPAKGHAHPQGKSINLDARTDNGKTVTVPRGRTINVSVPMEPGQGHRWIDRTRSPVLNLVGQSTGAAGGGAPGLVSGHATFTFQAMAAGQGRITLAYQPLDATKPPARTFTATVNVQDAGPPANPVYRSPSGKAYPPHWGAPPRRQTRDLRPLPGGYGRGSSTLAKWIGGNLDRDA
ncbi:MAG: protease inhibitor I42 family protein, partial [Phycisphaerae bacterium]|nr:protease inhibitor I42 family protein [Phycisphaerae bacterium]